MSATTDPTTLNRGELIASLVLAWDDVGRLGEELMGANAEIDYLNHQVETLTHLLSSPALVAGNPTGHHPPPPPVARGGERPSSQLPPRSAPGGRAAAGANGGGDARSATGVSPTNHALEQEGVA